MAFALHYQGALTDKRQLSAFLEEVEDIAASLGWGVQWYDAPWNTRPSAHIQLSTSGQPEVVGNLGLKGIALKIASARQPLLFCFGASGVLTSPVQVALSAAHNYEVTPTWIAAPTTELPPDNHIAIVHLLRYLQSKYLHDLEVADESGYWNHGDAAAVFAGQPGLEGLAHLARQASYLRKRDNLDIVEQIALILRKRADLE
ncbi:hypothetical protein [Phaeodactylibacter luteus]|uniref:Uncharacterized protein n=1 Tax=Phaeodactylibacter luteus TaxID=1564516 RepID=A0A5C6S5T0_9BACT|nr:hypothetical protein [Phaeodactylibacter luteus]TXB70198.1 hypothetical protein FRY97_00390 [Phaeodactylibacter luteus]